MLKACFEKPLTGESTWFDIPNNNLPELISTWAGDREWECVIIVGLKKDGITSFTNNCFHKCDIFQFNDMMLQANDFQYTDENLSVLNMLLEHYNYDCDNVINAYEDDKFKVYSNVVDMEAVAHEYLENTSEWYSEFVERNLLSYFDFKSYGEEVLGSSGNYIQDKYHKIIIEIFD